jgi:hypothetical protein
MDLSRVTHEARQFRASLSDTWTSPARKVVEFPHQALILNTFGGIRNLGLIGRSKTLLHWCIVEFAIHHATATQDLLNVMGLSHGNCASGLINTNTIIEIEIDLMGQFELKGLTVHLLELIQQTRAVREVKDVINKNSMNNNGVANSFDKDSLHIISSFVSQLVAKESYNVLLLLGLTLSKPVQRLVASPHHTSVIIR